MDPFRTNNQPTGAAQQAPPEYNPFGEGPAAQPYNPYAQQQQQQNFSPIVNQNQQYQQPQHGFYNNSAQYQNTNVAYNPNPGAPSVYQQPPPQQQQQQGFQQPQLSNAPPAPGTTAQPTRPPNIYAAPDPRTPIQPTSKFWTLQFYQQYFDVDTRQVLLRMGNTLLPITCPDFLSDLGWHWNQQQGVDTHGPNTSGQPGAAAPGAANIGAANPAANTNSMFETANGVLLNRNPDMYGPFWICTTLWMLTAIISNILSKISNLRLNSQNKTTAEANNIPYKEVEWNYDFTQASVALGTVYLYVLIMSFILWGISRWKDLPIQLTHCLCTYGYSMFLFVLAAILCIIPVGFLQWLACMIACAWSSLYIVLNFWFVWRNSLNRMWFMGVVALVCAAHFGLGMVFRFYFFSYDL